MKTVCVLVLVSLAIMMVSCLPTPEVVNPNNNIKEVSSNENTLISSASVAPAGPLPLSPETADLDTADTFLVGVGGLYSGYGFGSYGGYGGYGYGYPYGYGYGYRYPYYSGYYGGYYG